MEDDSASDQEFDLEDDSQDEGSISDSGFSPVNSAAAKGKGKSSNANSGLLGGEGMGGIESVGEVEFKVFSINKLREDQQTAIDYVKDMLSLKVSSSSSCLFRSRRSAR